MVSRILYTQAHARKPVKITYPPGLRDVQADIPAGWCRRCGAECYRPGADLCSRCQPTKGDHAYEFEVL